MRDYMLNKILKALVLSAFLSHSIYAEDIKISGSINIQKPIAKTNKIIDMDLKYPKNSYISLLKLELSANALKKIEKRAEKIKDSHKLLATPNQWMPTQIELGMNGVPVLNQGAHGSCVIFAVTAAIDAILGKGDYVSQICQLSLGRYIENYGHIPSGWNGAFSRNILSELDLFGFISKEVEKTNGCAGLTEYPESGEDLYNEEPITEFNKYSERLLANKISWSSIIDIFQASMDNVNEEEILLETKKVLLAGDRIAIGVILLDYQNGVIGAQGSYKSKNDSWVLTPEMISNINNQQNYVGHALLITGYNDKATAIDSEGRSHQGLLTLRNSWGNNIGDHGDFYMTYDYFKTLAIEAQRVRNLR